MSARSVRRAAELEVIEAAMKLGDLAYHYDLGNAVDRYKALGLEPATQTRTSRGAPVTSHMAAAYMHGRYVKSLVAWIVRLLYAAPEGGLTGDEIEMLTRRSHQSVSPRLNELRDNGWIVANGHLRQTRSGQPALVWKLTATARALLTQEEFRG